jgi:hypothetical protein
MIAVYLIHGTLYEDGSYTDTGEDFGGNYGYECDGGGGAWFSPSAESCLFGDDYCPLLDDITEQP